MNGKDLVNDWLGGMSPDMGDLANTIDEAIENAKKQEREEILNDLVGMPGEIANEDASFADFIHGLKIKPA